RRARAAAAPEGRELRLYVLTDEYAAGDEAAQHVCAHVRAHVEELLREKRCVLRVYGAPVDRFAPSHEIEARLEREHAAEEAAWAAERAAGGIYGRGVRTLPRPMARR